MSGSDGSPYQISQVNGGAPLADVLSVATVGGGVAAPGGSVNLCTTPTLPAGIYAIRAQLLVAGTPAAADVNNFRLVKSTGGTLISGLIAATGGAVGAGLEVPSFMDIMRFTADGTWALRLQTVTAATAGTLYFASLMAAQVG